MKQSSIFTCLQRWCWSLCSLLITTSAFAAGEEPLTLRPPKDELRPSFWEQHGWIIVLAAFALLGLVAFLIRLLQRPKPVVVIPPEIAVRQALSALQNRPEDAALVTEVSRILKRYICSTFNLPAPLINPCSCSIVFGGPRFAMRWNRKAGFAKCPI